MNKYDLSGKIALVTGGAQGIGLSVATRMYESGAHVVIVDIDEVFAQTALAAMPDRSSFHNLDITKPDLVERNLKEIHQSLGSIDILVNSAGIAGPNAKVIDYKFNDWKQILEINLDGTFNMCRATIPYMVANNYGRIVNIASVAGKEGNPNAAPYSTSKAGVIALTKSLGKEHADLNIAINCVTPAAAKTRIFDQMSQEHIDFMLSKIPRGRFLEVTEAASMIAWLCSEENSFSTGAVFDLSGGRATY
ncbi:MAG: SDR family NAD(P)-dependent oxidoreductase [Paracoccaceae bacterium]|nr:SDR family NAD(P)-dependent oxidoreductase [Paracoccaceae bacterium]